VRHSLIIACGLSLLGATLATEGRQSSVGRSNILLITIDTLRADRLGSYGYKPATTPNLDRLAAEGVRFADATAHSPLTLPAHVSIMTGRYQARYGIRLNGIVALPDTAVTVAERLRDAGYQTSAIVASAILDESYGLGQGFAHYDDDMPPVAGQSASLSELQRRGRDVADLASAWLDARPQAPWFLWLHVFDPHLPYDAAPVFEKAHPARPYDAEVAAADSAVGQVLKKIDRASTFVVVTADHGESLGDHRELDHGYYLYDATLRVPLLIAGPGLAPRLVREQVRSVDLAPTLESMAGLPARAGLDGESLVPLLTGGSRRDVPVSYAESWYPRLHFGWSELRAMRVGEWKYVAAPRPELYDLRTDRGESKNLVAERASVAARLSAELSALVQGFEPTSGPAAPQPDEETLARLRALGYVGTLAPVGTGTATEDPKDHILHYREYRQSFNQALGAMDQGRVDLAVPLLKALASANVRGFEVHLYLGNAYAAQGNPDAALGEYDAAGQLNPQWAMPHFEAAKVLVGRRDIAAAIARVRQGLTLEPRSFYGLYTSGVVYQRAGLPQDAMEAFRAAIAVNGRDPRAHANLADVALKLGALEAAAAAFERMIALNYRVAPAHYNLGLMAQRTGDRAEAERRFQLALKADPSFKPAREALAKLK
jgi:arylsulfatase A-like enzyme/Tfp pilus assembly protein PilF